MERKRGRLEEMRQEREGCDRESRDRGAVEGGS